MNPIAEDILMHYGVKRRSGRYPWGSGDDPYQRANRDLLGRIEELKKAGWTETAENVRKEFGIGLKEYREQKSIAVNERKLYQFNTAKRLREKEGMGWTAIARELGESESTVRGWFKVDTEAKVTKAQGVADHIRKLVDEKGMIDIGAGVERELGISKEMLNKAIKLLEEEGYPNYSGRIEQVTNRGKHTTQKVICPPGTPHKAIYELDKVHALNEDNYVSRDGGQTFEKFKYPTSLDSKRLQVRYAEDGGVDKDGIIELRRGVADLDLGGQHYSQVRIMVDGTHYLKGMAVYSDDLPPGVDIMFNTNKTKDVPALGPKNNTVLKLIKDDPENPFGSLIKANGQSYYTDKDGNQQLSLINKRADQGDWSDWADALPSQFLSKQTKTLAKRQLDLAKDDKQEEYDAICALTNPTVKKHLLEEFASNCDAAAVHLKAAALPGQKYHVIIPVNTLKDNEVYAPNYNNGDKVALIRYPHGGTFEIPILTVNNKHKPAEKLIGPDSVDAVGINKKIADQLSGADFDGDTVMVIPTNGPNKIKITATDPLEGLKGFEPKEVYAERPGMQYMTKKGTQQQMGVISNLITDMTLGHATKDELARAVRHSMVVIDAEKHRLDYKKSEIDNDIKGLREKYQRTVQPDGSIKIGGASTIISRAKGQATVDKRQGTPKVNIKGTKDYDPTRPEGALIYKTADDVEYTYNKINKRTGEITVVTDRKTQKSVRMLETDDAYSLVSDEKHPMEVLYADYANSMKAMANRARKEAYMTGNIEYSKTAAEIYKNEAASLKDKLNTALKNAPRERAAQRRAHLDIERQQKLDPDMSKEDIKKASQKAISNARIDVGSVSRRDRNIEITPKEWEAIQAGAVHESTLRDILKNTDVSVLRQYATPRATTTLSPAKINKIKALQQSKLTLAEIAEVIGVSTSTVANYLKGAA